MLTDRCLQSAIVVESQILSLGYVKGYVYISLLGGSISVKFPEHRHVVQSLHLHILTQRVCRRI